MPDLNCTKFEARLKKAVENRRTLGDSFEEESADWQELRAQANVCPHCRRLWNEFALLDRVLPIWKEHVPRVDLADAVIARWRQEQASENHAPPSASPPGNGKKSRWSSLFGIVMVVAACVLAIVPFWFSPNTNQDLPDTIPIATTNPNPPKPSNETPGPESRHLIPEETVPQVDWQALAQDAGSAYWVLASDAADSFASVTVFVPARKAAADVPQPVEDKSAAGWGVAEIGTGLKPIGQDVSRAMDFLFDALPGEQPTL